MKLLSRLFAFGAISFYLLSPSAIVFAAAPKPTCFLSVTPTSINAGGTVVLKWISTNATGGAITSVGNVGPSGQANLLPPLVSRTTYVGSFTGPGGTANCSATVAVSFSSGGTSGGDTGTQTTAPPASAPVTTIPTNTTNSQTGLIPCGYGTVTYNDKGGNTSDSATGCQACDLASLIQNIINFAIGISIPIAAALFAWAGVLYFTSAGDHHKLDQAKGIFKNAFIGFLIAISAWLVINTFLHVLLSQGQFAGGGWFTVQCSDANQRPNDTNIGGVLSTILGIAPINNSITSTAPSGGACDSSLGGCFDGTGNSMSTQGAYSCPSGFQIDNGSGYVDDSGNAATGVSCVKSDSSGNVTAEVAPTCQGNYSLSGGVSDVNASNYAGTCVDSSGVVAPVPLPSTSVGRPLSLANPQMQAEIQAACSQYNLDSSACALATRIAQNESSGGKNCTTSNTGAAGCMQVLATTACGMDPSISDSCNSCLQSRNSIRPQCAPVIDTISSNTQLGTSLGVKYVSQMYNQNNGSCQLAAAAYFQGQGAVNKYGGVPPNAVSYVATACK